MGLGIKDMGKCPASGLIIPNHLIDEKQSLKKSIDDLVDNAVNQVQHRKEPYFLTIHALFDVNDPSLFRVSPVKVSDRLPPFRSNTMVFWVSNARGIKELLWMVSCPQKGKKLKVEFNKSGVAYLQAKGAMPS